MGGALTKVGSGIFLISGASTYSGATIVNGGTLQAGSPAAFSPSSAFTVNARLDLNGNSNSIASLAGSGLVTNSGQGPATLTAGGNNSNTTFSGTLTDGASLGLTKIGSGTLVLSGSNTYSGGTNIDGGTLAVRADTNLGSGPLSFNAGTLEALGTGGGITSAKSITLQSGGGVFLADIGTTSALTGTIEGPGSLVKDGPGTPGSLGRQHLYWPDGAEFRALKGE